MSAVVTVLLAYSQHSVTFIISSLPSNSKDSNLFLAGSFNAWNPENRNFGFQKNKKDGVSDSVGQGTYWLGIKLASGMYEFKVTRGGWDKVECKRAALTFRTDF